MQGTSGAVISLSGSVIGGTPGSVLYVDAAGSLAQDNANFFWDSTNHRLGVLTAAPAYDFDMGTTGSPTARFNQLRIQTISESSNTNNILILMASTGAVFTRNINDANTCLIIQQAHASSTGDICQFKNNVGVVATVTQSGDFYQVRSRYAGAAAPGSPVDGDIWNDSTQKALIEFVDGIKQNITGCIYSLTADGTVTDTNAEGVIYGTGVGTITLPANFFIAGKTLRIKASGWFSNTDGAQNIIFKVRLGGVGGTIMGQTAALAVGVADSYRFWKLEEEITCRTTGAPGTFYAQGHVIADAATITASDMLSMPNAATTNVTTTGALDVAVTAKWAVTGANDTCHCTNMTIEVLN